MRRGNAAENTALSIVYRDLDGFEINTRCVVKGPATNLQIAEIKSCLDGDDRFIPAQVDLPGKRPSDFNTQIDTCWFSLRNIKHTSDKANCSLNVGELVDKFRKAAGNWDESLYTAVAIEGSRSY